MVEERVKGTCESRKKTRGSERAGTRTLALGIRLVWVVVAPAGQGATGDQGRLRKASKLLPGSLAYPELPGHCRTSTRGCSQLSWQRLGAAQSWP